MKWKVVQLWRRSALNTLWYLIGCSIGNMWLACFLAPWPYNYWRLAKHDKSCCHAE